MATRAARGASEVAALTAYRDELNFGKFVHVYTATENRDAAVARKSITEHRPAPGVAYTRV